MPGTPSARDDSYDQSEDDESDHALVLLHEMMPPRYMARPARRRVEGSLAQLTWEFEGLAVRPTTRNAAAAIARSSPRRPIDAHGDDLPRRPRAPWSANGRRGCAKGAAAALSDCSVMTIHRARSRATRSSVGGWVVNSLANWMRRPVSGLTMYLLAWAGCTAMGTTREA